MKKLGRREKVSCTRPAPITPDAEDCRRIYLAVIMQVFYDLKSSNKQIQGEAERWLHSGEDFSLVCDLAGVDPVTIMKHSEMLLAGGELSKHNIGLLHYN